MNFQLKWIKRCTLLFVVTILSSGCDPKVLQVGFLEWGKNHQSMDFYGKIVDQENHPVVGVKVTAGTLIYEGPSRSGSKSYYTESDIEGKFNFVGIHGARCGYGLEKAGYAFNQRLPCASRPDNFVPDPEKPVIFQVWKLRGAEPIVISKVHTYIPCDGSSSTFDLLTGRPNGELKITLTRTPVNIKRGTPFDWTVTLEIADGGLTEIQDTYPYEAPLSGYHTITFVVSAGAKQWTPDLQRWYYFKHGQNYGRIYVDLTSDFQPPPTFFDADVFINPSGSRDLEYDRSKQITR